MTGNWILLKCYYQKKEVNLNSVFGTWKEELEYWAEQIQSKE